MNPRKRQETRQGPSSISSGDHQPRVPKWRPPFTHNMCQARSHHAGGVQDHAQPPNPRSRQWRSEVLSSIRQSELTMSSVISSHARAMSRCMCRSIEPNGSFANPS